MGYSIKKRELNKPDVWPRLTNAERPQEAHQESGQTMRLNL